MWNRRGVSVADKYRYLYDRDELASWVPRVLDVAETAEDTHIVFNNCYANYGTTNAREMSATKIGSVPNMRATVAPAR